MATLTLARAYQHSFDSHPHFTLAVTGATLNALGDVVAQFTQNTWSRKDDSHYNTRYDFVRTARFFCFGLAISPFMGRWNAFLERRFPFRALAVTTATRTRTPAGVSTRFTSAPPKISLRALSKRVACDQLVMAPVGLALFLGSMGIMEGRTPLQIREKFKDLYPTALLTNWRVWPLAQLVNFRYMPLPYRVPFSQACGVFWTLYLSILNSEEDQKQDRREIIGVRG